MFVDIVFGIIQIHHLQSPSVLATTWCCSILTSRSLQTLDIKQLFHSYIDFSSINVHEIPCRFFTTFLEYFDTGRKWSLSHCLTHSWGAGLIDKSEKVINIVHDIENQCLSSPSKSRGNESICYSKYQRNLKCKSIWLKIKKKNNIKKYSSLTNEWKNPLLILRKWNRIWVFPFSFCFFPLSQHLQGAGIKVPYLA